MRRLTTALAAIVACLLLGGMLLATPAHADEEKTPQDKGVTVGLRTATAKGGDTRGRFEYEILPKGRIIDYVAVSNLRYTPVTVRLFAKDATTTTDSPYAVQKSSEQPTGIGSWMSIKKTKLTLPPRSETIVPFQLGVPYNASPGDHSGAIVVSLLAKEPKPDGGTIVVDHRVGLRVLLRVPGDYQPALTITDLKTDWGGPGTVLGRGDALVTYTVRNTGNLRVSATGDLKLSRVLGMPSVDARTESITEIQPGGEIQVRRVIRNVFGSGPMKAHLTLHPKTVDPKLEDITVKTVSETTAFSAWPWLLIALVVGLLALLGFGGWFERRRRRARKAAMAPTGGSHRSPIAPDSRTDDKSVLVRAAGAGFLAVLGLGLATPAAHADDADVWQGKASIQQGTDNTPFDMITTGGCPLPGTNVVGFAYGKGFPKEGGAVIGNGDAGVESRGPFRMPLSSSMQQLVAAQPDPAPLSGVYKIEMRCVTPGLEQTTGTYVFAIRFTDAHHWKAMPPLTTNKGPNTTSNDRPGAAGDPEDNAKGGTGTTGGSGSTGASGGLSAEELDAATKRAQELAGVEDAAQAAEEGGISWPLVGGGLAILAATGLYLRLRAKT